MDDKPLLRHQHVHRSRTTINELITSYYHTIPESEPQIIPLLSCTGFQHIALIKQCKIDSALITALCTITLEDVALHLGIRVDGRVVAGPSFLHWDELCHELVGEVPPENACKGAALKLTWLLNMLCAPLPKEPTTHQLQCRCRAYIMYMIGGALITDKYGNRVHLMYLNLLHDLNNTKKYSWGSACLANLYRELCRASLEVGKSMGGCVILLQSWAWYRMPFIAPRVPRPETTFPLAKRWSGGRLEYRATPHAVHQTFGHTGESVIATTHEWMTDLFGIDFNTPNSAASYLATLQQFNAPHSFGEQGQSSSAATTKIENTNIEQQHDHDVEETVILERRNPRRNRRPPPCGISHRLGH
ncbi:Protein MAIN-LIKE 2 [Glycine max]|nr:Protein MAIN-LIKE 2 [Glycine max]